MTSIIAWLDHNESDQRKMREVISLFREQNTVDELRIGVVRDTIANLLFPGTTTVQTRARYLLFLPWIFSDIERQRLTGTKAGTESRKLEVSLVYALEQGGHHGGEGVIGWEARERLRRFPSEIYWSGLGTYRIRQFVGSKEQYLDSLNAYNRQREAPRAGDGDEVHERLQPNWHRALPQPPADWLHSTTLTLRREDAEFLAERIMTSTANSLLAELVRSGTDVSGTPSPWDIADMEALDPDLRRQLDHARRFSQVMHSAPLVYNLMLAKRALSLGMSGKYPDWEKKHHRELEDWARSIEVPGQGAKGWDTEDFWNLIAAHNPHLGEPTRRFISNWIGIATASPDEIASASPHVCQVIETRERQVKGSQARLSNHRALERWKGEAGTRKIDYRWSVARQLMVDILEGLSNVAT